MAFVNRIYVDSRHRMVDSESTSDFRIELPETMQMDDNMHVIVTDVVIPITWLTVEEDINDKLYVRLIEATSENITYTDYILKIPSRNYNRQELAEAISDVCEARGLPLRANDDPFRNLIRIFLPADSQLQFMVFSDKDLQITGVILNFDFNKFSLNNANASGNGLLAKSLQDIRKLLPSSLKKAIISLDPYLDKLLSGK